MKLKHPKTGQTIEVRDGDEGPYLSQGWQKSAASRKKSEDSEKS